MIKFKKMQKACGELGIEKLLEITNKIYESGNIPPQMKKSVFITLPKKGHLPECSNHRLISLMIHIIKILIRVIMNRIKNIIQQKLVGNSLDSAKAKKRAL